MQACLAADARAPGTQKRFADSLTLIDEVILRRGWAAGESMDRGGCVGGSLATCNGLLLSEAIWDTVVKCAMRALREF